MKDLTKGDKVRVRERHSNPGEGLSYPAFQGELLEDAGASEGWDVVDVKEELTGDVISIYCFSLQRTETKSDEEGIRKWMRDNVSEYVDECNEVNATKLVEAWDAECGSGEETLDSDHIAWEIAAKVSEEYEKS